jgi:hypothetical protein
MRLAGLDLSPYHVAQVLLAAAGLAACAGLLAGRAGGRRVLIGAAAAYLVLAAARLFVVYTWKFLETDPWPVAVWNTFVIQWLFMVHMAADGSVAFGVLMLYYEWLMPLAQAVVLAALFRSRNQPV